MLTVFIIFSGISILSFIPAIAMWFQKEENLEEEIKNLEMEMFMDSNL